jgi:hypothetical protein
MKTYLAAGLSLALLAGAVVAANSVKSGPQVGQELAGPFHPLNINGDAAGKKNCLYCDNGSNPVIMVFAREPNATVAQLIKKIDETTVKNKGCDMGSFVVFCSAEKGLEGELKELAKKLDLKKCVLAIDNPAGPDKYDVAKEADVTVVLYVDRKVKANHAFKKGELKEKDIETILADVSKIVPAK